MKLYLFAGAAFATLAAAPVLAQPQQGGPRAMPMPQTRAELQQMVEQGFVAADADRNGFVSRAEMLQAAGSASAERVARRFDRMDGDKDGKLSKDEMSRPLFARFDRADGDRDGTISAKELEASQAAMRARREARNGGSQARGEEPPQGE